MTYSLWGWPQTAILPLEYITSLLNSMPSTTPVTMPYDSRVCNVTTWSGHISSSPFSTKLPTMNYYTITGISVGESLWVCLFFRLMLLIQHLLKKCLTMLKKRLSIKISISDFSWKVKRSSNAGSPSQRGKIRWRRLVPSVRVCAPVCKVLSSDDSCFSPYLIYFLKIVSSCSKTNIFVYIHAYEF